MKTDELLEKILRQAGQATPTPTPTPTPGPRGAVSTPPSNIPVAPLPIQRDTRLYYQREQEPSSRPIQIVPGPTAPEWARNYEMPSAYYRRMGLNPPDALGALSAASRVGGLAGILVAKGLGSITQPRPEQMTTGEGADVPEWARNYEIPSGYQTRMGLSYAREKFGEFTWDDTKRAWSIYHDTYNATKGDWVTKANAATTATQDAIPMPDGFYGASELVAEQIALSASFGLGHAAKAMQLGVQAGQKALGAYRGRVAAQEALEQARSIGGGAANEIMGEVTNVINIPKNKFDRLLRTDKGKKVLDYLPTVARAADKTLGVIEGGLKGPIRIEDALGRELLGGLWTGSKRLAGLGTQAAIRIGGPVIRNFDNVLRRTMDDLDWEMGEVIVEQRTAEATDKAFNQSIKTELNAYNEKQNLFQGIAQTSEDAIDEKTNHTLRQSQKDKSLTFNTNPRTGQEWIEDDSFGIAIKNLLSAGLDLANIVEQNQATVRIADIFGDAVPPEYAQRMEMSEAVFRDAVEEVNLALQTNNTSYLGVVSDDNLEALEAIQKAIQDNYTVTTTQQSMLRDILIDITNFRGSDTQIQNLRTKLNLLDEASTTASRVDVTMSPTARYEKLNNDYEKRYQKYVEAAHLGDEGEGLELVTSRNQRPAPWILSREEWEELGGLTDAEKQEWNSIRSNMTPGERQVAEGLGGLQPAGETGDISTAGVGRVLPSGLRQLGPDYIESAAGEPLAEAGPISQPGVGFPGGIRYGRITKSTRVYQDAKKLDDEYTARFKEANDEHRNALEMDPEFRPVMSPEGALITPDLTVDEWVAKGGITQEEATQWSSAKEIVRNVLQPEQDIKSAFSEYGYREKYLGLPEQLFPKTIATGITNVHIGRGIGVDIPLVPKPKGRILRALSWIHPVDRLSGSEAYALLMSDVPIKDKVRWLNAIWPDSWDGYKNKELLYRLSNPNKPFTEAEVKSAIRQIKDITYKANKIHKWSTAGRENELIVYRFGEVYEGQAMPVSFSPEAAMVFWRASADTSKKQAEFITKAIDEVDITAVGIPKARLYAYRINADDILADIDALGGARSDEVLYGKQWSTDKFGENELLVSGDVLKRSEIYKSQIEYDERLWPQGNLAGDKLRLGRNPDEVRNQLKKRLGREPTEKEFQDELLSFPRMSAQDIARMTPEEYAEYRRAYPSDAEPVKQDYIADVSGERKSTFQPWREQGGIRGWLARRREDSAQTRVEETLLGSPPYPRKGKKRVKVTMGNNAAIRFPSLHQESGSFSRLMQNIWDNSFVGRRMDNELRNQMDRKGLNSAKLNGSPLDIATARNLGAGGFRVGLYKVSMLTDTLSQSTPNISSDNWGEYIQLLRIRDLKTAAETAPQSLNKTYSIYASTGKSKGTQVSYKSINKVNKRIEMLARDLGDNAGELDTAVRIIQDAYRRERDLMVAHGFISKADNELWNRVAPYYSPFTFSKNPDNVRMMRKKKLTTGYEVLDTNIFEIDDALRVEAKPAMEAIAEQLIRNEVKRRNNDVVRAYVDTGMALEQRAGQFRRVTSADASPTTVTLWREGQAEYYHVPELVYREITETHDFFPEHKVGKFITDSNQLMRHLYTTYNPAFAFGMLPTDLLTAYIGAGTNPLAAVAMPGLRKLAAKLTNTEASDAMLNEVYQLTGAGQPRFTPGVEGHGDRFQGVLSARQMKDIERYIARNNGVVVDSPLSLSKKIFQSIQEGGRWATESMEQAPRKQFFRERLDKLVPNWKTMDPYELAEMPVVKRAASEAVELTINFNRGAYLTKKLNPYLIFLNASFEGFKIPVRQLITNEQTRAGAQRRLAYLAIANGALNHYNMSYEEYWDIPEDIRHGSLLVMLPSTQKNERTGRMIPNYIVLMPRMREWSLIFGWQTAVTEQFKKDSPDSAWAVATLLGTRFAGQFEYANPSPVQVNPFSAIAGTQGGEVGYQSRMGFKIPVPKEIMGDPLVDIAVSISPPIIGTPLEIAANRDTYFKQDIVSEGIQKRYNVETKQIEDVPTSEQVEPTTSGLAKFINRLPVGGALSPIQYDHALHSLGGFPVRAAIDTGNFVADLFDSQYDDEILEMKKRYDNLDRKGQDQLFAQIKDPDKRERFRSALRTPDRWNVRDPLNISREMVRELPVIGDIVRRFDPQRTGGIYESGLKVAEEETGYSSEAYQTVGKMIRNHQDDMYRAQYELGQKLQPGKPGGNTWDEYRKQVKETIGSANTMFYNNIRTDYPDAPQSAESPEEKEDAAYYYDVLNTVKDTVEDSRTREQILYAKYNSFGVEEELAFIGDDEPSPYLNKKFDERDAWVRSLDSSDAKLLNERIDLYKDPFQQELMRAQRDLKIYFEAGHEPFINALISAPKNANVANDIRNYFNYDSKTQARLRNAGNNPSRYRFYLGLEEQLSAAKRTGGIIFIARQGILGENPWIEQMLIKYDYKTPDVETTSYGDEIPFGRATISGRY